MFFVGEIAEVCHGGCHHHPAYRRHDQACAGAGRGEVLPAGPRQRRARWLNISHHSHVHQPIQTLQISTSEQRDPVPNIVVQLNFILNFCCTLTLHTVQNCAGCTLCTGGSLTVLLLYVHFTSSCIVI